MRLRRSSSRCSRKRCAARACCLSSSNFRCRSSFCLSRTSFALSTSFALPDDSRPGNNRRGSISSPLPRNPWASTVILLQTPQIVNRSLGCFTRTSVADTDLHLGHFLADDWYRGHIDKNLLPSSPYFLRSVQPLHGECNLDTNRQPLKVLGRCSGYLRLL